MSKLELLREISKHLPPQITQKIFAEAQKWSAENLREFLSYWLIKN